MAAGIILRKDVKKRKNHKLLGGFSGAGVRPAGMGEKSGDTCQLYTTKGVFCSPRAFYHIIEF
jgi:hypothetical protein